MKCPYCGGESQVIDCRLRQGKFKWRRRKCKSCEKKFATHEIYAKDYNKPMAFIKGEIK